MNAITASLIALAMFGLTSHVAEAAGPFGVEMGMPISTLSGCERATDGMYLCATVPRPHSAFESYAAAAHPSTGICKISGIGKDIDDNGFGFHVKRSVDELVEQVAGTYGKPTTSFDSLVPGSIWNERDEWLMGILRKQRYYTFMWLESDGYVPRNNVTAIEVEASATASDSGYASVRFEFANVDRCMDAIKQKDKSAF